VRRAQRLIAAPLAAPEAWVYLRIWMTFSMPRVVCSRPSWVSMKHAITQYPGF
jgi:hypothetical protein